MAKRQKKSDKNTANVLITQIIVLITAVINLIIALINLLDT